MKRSFSFRRARRRMRLSVLIAVLAFTGCDSVNEQPPALIAFDAVVMMAVLPGPNTWVLDDLASDASYYPINLPTDFHREGVRVHVRGYHIRDYQVLLHDPIEIISITILDEADS